MVARFLLVAVVASFLGAASSFLMITNLVHGNIRETVVSQQTEFAHYIALDVDDQLHQLSAVLQSAARRLPPELIDQPAELDRWLAQREALHPLFQGGLQVVPRAAALSAGDEPSLFSGTRSAKVVGPQRRLPQPGADDTVWQLVQVQGKLQLWMAAPVRQRRGGEVKADLVGVVEFSAEGLFTGLLNTRLSSSREISLSTPEEGLVLASTYASPSSAVGTANADLPQGQVMTNAQGEDVLLSFALVESTGWRVEVSVPVTVAFTGLERTKKTLVVTNLVRTLVALAVVWGISVWQLRPLSLVAAQAQRMTRGDEPLRPIAVARHDEVGHLTSAFNDLLSKLGAKNDELALMAYHDNLTGLPNRKMLFDRLQQALARSQRSGQSLILLYMDLNGFKALNDTVGHDAGDEALKQVAARLTGVVREVDTVARLGGDEFVLLAPDVADAAEPVAQQLAQKCMAAIAQPMEIQGQSQMLGVAIGVAVFDGTWAADPVLKAADDAMYDAKEQCRAEQRSVYVLHTLGSAA
jgi:diguanylate cyclase